MKHPEPFSGEKTHLFNFLSQCRLKFLGETDKFPMLKCVGNVDHIVHGRSINLNVAKTIFIYCICVGQLPYKPRLIGTPVEMCG
jgi:hypothetical protein